MKSSSNDQPDAPELPKLELFVHSSSEDVPPRRVAPLTAKQLLHRADVIRRQQQTQDIVRMVHLAFGEGCGAYKVVLIGGEMNYGSMRYEHFAQLQVLDQADRRILPDFSLPFWADDFAEFTEDLVGQPREALFPEESGSPEYPEEGTPAFILVEVLHHLISNEFGTLDPEEEICVDLASAPVKEVLDFVLPDLFVAEAAGTPNPGELQQAQAGG